MTALKFPIHPLRRLAAVSPSSVDKKSRAGEAPVRLCNYTDVYYHGAITDQIDFMNATASADQIRRFQLRKGDTLITKDSESWTDIGVAAFVPESLPDVLCGYHLAVLRPTSPAVVPKYLYWALQSSYVLSQLHTAATGVTRFGLRTGAIRSLSVPLPAADHQRQIVDFLDRETARIDELIQAKQRLAELLWERQRREWWAATSPPEQESGWRRYKIGLAFRMGSGTTPPSAEKRFYGGGIPWVLTGDLPDGLVTSTQKTITQDAINEFSALNVYPAGSLVIAMYGATIGKLGQLAFPAAVNQACCVLQPRGGVDPQYAFYWFLANRNDVVAQGVGGGQPNISQDIIRRLGIWAPPLADQRRIVARLDQRTALVRGIVDTVDTQVGLLRERRRALITAAVTGQLDITGDGAYEELEKATA